MKVRVLVLVVSSVALTMGGRVVLGEHAAPSIVDHSAHMHSTAAVAVSRHLALPSAATTKMLLEGAVHQSEFVDVPVGPDRMRAYVSYPDRADRAPVVMVTAGEQGMSDWARAVAYQLSRDGFVAIVPDYVSGFGPAGGGTDSFKSGDAIAAAARRISTEEMARRAEAVRTYVARIPSANGAFARVDIENGHISARLRTESYRSSLDEQGWSDTLTFLTRATNNRFDPVAHMDHVAMEAMALQASAQAAGRGQGGRGQGGNGQPAQRPGSGLTDKRDDLPSNYVMAARVVDETPRRNEWVDVPMGNVKIHTWVVYPAGTAKVGAVLVLHGAQGATEWVRAVADQIAHDGFIALVPDLSSGLGPNGGNFDSFKYQDERMAATGKLGREGTMARLKAVREYAARMPRSNGKTGSLGFCGGGTNSFTLATDVPEHNASVVFYGGPPPTASLANIKAPVIGFYGENDVRIASTVEGTRAEMKRLGKSYEAHLYPKTTHSFLWMQDLGDNFLSTEDAWPKAIAFLRQHLDTPAPATR